jgi:predicted neutral ceramidase superfamily lipid hydrolase
MDKNIYITTKDAAKRFSKSISTIKRVVAVAPDNALQYEPSRTAKNRRLFISVEFLEGKFADVRNTTTSHHQNDITLILQKELQDKQNTIDRLLDANNKQQENANAIIKQLTENEERMQILLERGNQRNDLLQSHFERNKKMNPSTEDEIIQDAITEDEPIIEESSFIDTNDEHSFKEWLNSLK